MTDVATGWTSARTVRTKGERVVAGALDRIQVGLPFHLAGIHSDNGSEFINHHLFRWCETRQITFTRGRPARSNDNAHVEQKNWALVRRTAGYFRYDTPTEEHLLDQMWAHQDVLFNPADKPSTRAEPRSHPHPATGHLQMSQRPNTSGQVDMSHQESSR